MKSAQTSSPYGYTPSVAMSVIGTIGFCAAAMYLIFQYVQTRCWFLIPIIIGALMEVIGYTARVISTTNLTNVVIFFIQFLAIILAPSLLAAGCYTVFGRLVCWVTPNEKLRFRNLWFPPRWITLIFVLFDTFAFLFQLAGISRIGSGFGPVISPQDKQNDINSGMHILKLGLGLQLLCFGLFFLITFRFLLFSRKWSAPDGVTNWRRLNMAVTGAAGLITLRSIYRLFEFTGSVETGGKNYLNTHEWAFWMCDALPILLSLIIFCAVFPSHYLPHSFCRFRLNKKIIGATKPQGTEMF